MKTILLFLCGLCMAWTAWGQASYQWHYWIDSGQQVEGTGTFTGENPSIQPVLDNLNPGMHTITIQVVDSSGVASPSKTALFYHFRRSSVNHAYYWFDDDVENIRNLENVSGGIIDATGLSNGIHSVTVQVVDERGVASPSQTALFCHFRGKAIERVCYWFDNDVENIRELEDVSGGMIDASELADGIHFIHCVADDGKLSTAETRMFLKPLRVGGDKDWTCHILIDNKLCRTEHIADGGSTSWAIEADTLSLGLHQYTLLAVSSDGKTASTRCGFFLRIPSFKDMEGMQVYYTVDDDSVANVLPGSKTDDSFTFNLDMTDLKDGEHTLNYWFAGINAPGITFMNTPFRRALTEVQVEDNLILAAGTRYEDEPAINVVHGVNFVIEGEEGMILKEVVLDHDLASGSYAQVLSESDLISVNGDVSERIYTQGLTWYFLCLPFDCDLSRLTNEDGAFYAIRYYDGQSRAASGTANGNWKNYDVQTDIIPMGAGFIYMTSKDAWTRFYAVDNERKGHVFVSKDSETTTPLERNESASFVHRGWNLVGNPYTNYYDGGEVSFQNPLTMWNGQTYDACYTRDDNFIIRPGQAFFVQCPKDGESIGFPGSGRQLTDSLSQTAGAKVRRAKAEGRRLVNLTLASGTFEDHTRVVINESAAASYELSCDASKFLSLKSDVPQLYSLGSDGTKYAINERPLADGKVSLGVYIPAEGSYTLHMTRNDAQRVLLRDSETSQSVDLSDGAYTFQARKGTYANRLSLWIDTDATGITELAIEEGETTPTYYTLDGRPLQGEPVTTGVYLVKTGNTVKKVYVRK